MSPALLSTGRGYKKGWVSPALSTSGRRPVILVTAGPTREHIDPVRFISNHSTGMFGYAIAAEARRRGNRVVLITGPTSLQTPQGVKTVKVETALEMKRAVQRELRKGVECLIMAAAVCDWRPRFPATQKLKRKGRRTVLELVENPNIVSEVGWKKPKGLVVVGFALETGNLAKNAAIKLKRKNLDLVVANKLARGRSVFGSGSFDVLMLDRMGNKAIFRRRSKRTLAKIILDKALTFNI